MIAHLRQRHRRTFVVLAVLIPGLLAWALLARKTPPIVEHAPGAAHAGHEP